MDFSRFVGIDVGKAELHAAVLGPKSRDYLLDGAYDHDTPGISSLVRALGDPGNVLVVVENSGRLCERLVFVLHAEGFFVWLCTPNALAQGTLGMNRLKDDPHDARQLALLARTYREQAVQWAPDDPKVERLRRMRSRRRQLVRDRTRIMNQTASEKAGHAADALVLRQLAQQKALLDNLLADIEKEIEGLVASIPGYARKGKVLASIPSIGKVMATQALILTEGFTKITSPEAFAAFVSTAPYARASGASGRKSRKVSKKGDRRTKAILCCGVVSSATRPKGFWREDYLRLIEEGRHHNDAINVIINKVIRLMFALVMKDETFDKKKYLENRRPKLDRKLQLS